MPTEIGRPDPEVESEGDPIFASPAVIVPVCVGVGGGMFVTGFFVGDVPLYLLPYALMVSGAGFCLGGMSGIVLSIRRLLRERRERRERKR